MCDPLSIIGFGANAMQQVLAIQSQTAAAAAQADAHNRNMVLQKEAWQRASKAAGDSLADQTAQEGVRVQQEQVAATNKMLELHKEGLRAKGDVLASSIGGGLSEELLIDDVARQEATYTDIIANNVKAIMQQSQVNKKGMAADAQSRANAGAPIGFYQSAPETNYLAMGLGIAGAGIDAYDAYRIKPVKGDIVSRRKPEQDAI